MGSYFIFIWIIEIRDWYRRYFFS